jgi:hypothetical protein
MEVVRVNLESSGNDCNLKEQWKFDASSYVSQTTPSVTNGLQLTEDGGTLFVGKAALSTSSGSLIWASTDTDFTQEWFSGTSRPVDKAGSLILMSAFTREESSACPTFDCAWLKGINANTGQTTWQEILRGYTSAQYMVFSPSGTQGYITDINAWYQDASQSILEAVSTSSGKVAWTRTINGGFDAVVRCPQAINGDGSSLFKISCSRSYPPVWLVSAFSTADGSTIWTYGDGTTTSASAIVFSPETNQLYIASTSDGNSHVYALSADTGNVLWSWSPTSSSSTISSIILSPSGGMLYAATSDGDITGITAHLTPAPAPSPTASPAASPTSPTPAPTNVPPSKRKAGSSGGKSSNSLAIGLGTGLGGAALIAVSAAVCITVRRKQNGGKMREPLLASNTGDAGAPGAVEGQPYVQMTDAPASGANV